MYKFMCIIGVYFLVCFHMVVSFVLTIAKYKDNYFLVARSAESIIVILIFIPMFISYFEYISLIRERNSCLLSIYICDDSLARNNSPEYPSSPDLTICVC